MIHFVELIGFDLMNEVYILDKMKAGSGPDEQWRRWKFVVGIEIDRPDVVLIATEGVTFHQMIEAVHKGSSENIVLVGRPVCNVGLPWIEVDFEMKDLLLHMEISDTHVGGAQRVNDFAPPVFQITYPHQLTKGA